MHLSKILVLLLSFGTVNGAGKPAEVKDEAEWLNAEINLNQKMIEAIKTENKSQIMAIFKSGLFIVGYNGELYPVVYFACILNKSEQFISWLEESAHQARFKFLED